MPNLLRASAVLFLLILLSFQTALAVDAAILQEKLKAAMKDGGFKPSEVGLWVGRRSEKGNEKIFGVSDDALMIPASLSKLISAGAVLHTLHPSYKYKTELLAKASVKNGALGGPLYIKGGGDPSFVSENMWVLVNHFTRTGITSIEGDIVVDDNRFDSVRIDEDRESVRVDRAYDAPVGAMSMNWNSVNVYVRPSKDGGPCEVTADPVNTYIQVRNLCKTVSGSAKAVTVERTTDKAFWGDVVTVSGKIGTQADEVVIYKNISRPDLWTGAHLLEFLKQRGIIVKGKVTTGMVPKDAKVLAFSESKPLSQIVADMEKWSNNYVAEMLVKNLAAEAGSQPATMADGLKVVQKFAQQVGIAEKGFVFINASGFTRENRITAAQFGKFLTHIQADFTIFPEYVMALPIAGVDGTLKSRMKGSKGERWVRAKTGLLNGVVGLAGYAGETDGEVISFAFMYNGSAGKEVQARAFFDKLAAVIAQN
jgi:serine-type D-Ala-D-Ala carboxypeptidase/endopeptidase (penicillin-binding protein 4)